jgi:hypothetical protein
MKVENLKDLKKLIQLCRQLGVDAFEVGEIKFNLGSLPQPIRQSKAVKTTITPTLAPGGITDDTKIPTSEWDTMTDEQKLFWSAQETLTIEEQ